MFLPTWHRLSCFGAFPLMEPHPSTPSSRKPSRHHLSYVYLSPYWACCRCLEKTRSIGHSFIQPELKDCAVPPLTPGNQPHSILWENRLREVRGLAQGPKCFLPVPPDTASGRGAGQAVKTEPPCPRD